MCQLNENEKFKIVEHRQGESYSVGEVVDILTEFKAHTTLSVSVSLIN
jgi:hypothetical protein